MRARFPPSTPEHPRSGGDDLAALCVLTSLPQVGPARMRWLLQGTSAVEALEALRRRRLPTGTSEPNRPRGVTDALCRRWFDEASRLDAADLLRHHDAAGIQILDPAHAHWPFGTDPEPPAVVFAVGDTTTLVEGRRVAIVGTRRSTTVGRRVAHDLGRDLAEGGFSVVSGLALGIDGAAHRGALAADEPAAAPIAVVAGGLDHVYPPVHRDLWADIARVGVVISECPLGTRPDRWRFPARNRLIAGLSELVVVVESHARGGALLTVDEAAERGVPVVAVPGSVHSAAAAGTNALLIDGCAPVRHAEDVFDHLGGRRQSVEPTDPRPHRHPGSSTTEPLVAAVLDELANGELHLERLLNRLTGHGPIGLPDLIRLVGKLEEAELVTVVGNRVRRAEPSGVP